MPAALPEIVELLESVLTPDAIPDYPGAVNGLQVANDRPVERVACAVDASLPVVRQAAEGGAQLLIVHHGLFWGGAKPLTGATYEKYKIAITHGLAVYASHIPLDVHPELGNNALLARALRLEAVEPFFPWKGIQLGLRGRTDQPRDAFLSSVGSAVGGPVHLAPGGPETVREVGVITGGAGSEIEAAAATGIDTFVTGEGPHWSHPAAEEVGINLVYAGHYATETFGVKALGRLLERDLSLPWQFINHPTGL